MQDFTLRIELRIQFRLFAVGTLVALLPFTASAVSIGDISLQSKLGEPLRARVDVTLDKGERLNDACLSLTLPDPRDDDPSGYIIKAELAYKGDDAHSYISISTPDPFNEAFAKFRLQIKCPGTGNLIKTFIALPDVDASAVQAPIAAPVVPETNAVPAPVGAAPAAAPQAAPVAAPEPAPALEVKPIEAKPQAGKKPEAAKPPLPKPRVKHKAKPRRKEAPAQAEKKEPQPPKAVSPKVVMKIQPTGAPLGDSRGKGIADDQMADILEMQHQVKELQAELAAMRLKLAQAGLEPAVSAPAALNVASPLSPAASLVPATSIVTAASAASATEAAKPKPVAVKPPAAPEEEGFSGMFAISGSLIAALVLLGGLRYYFRRRQSSASLDTSAAGTIPVKPVIAPSSPKPQEPAPQGAPAAPLHATAAVSDEDLMLEEASLYVSHKREAKAIEILQEILNRNPASVEAWSLLLSTYAGQGNKDSFALAAKECLDLHKDPALTGRIKSWGRVLDPGNPLYR
jgi:pilus assembly protein FimV